jgi:uncharacterized protein (DUF1697 family)
MLRPMPVVISMLRGVNVGGHNKIKMDALRDLYESLGLRDAQTYVQSGNVIFKTKARDAAPLAKQIEDAIERKFGFCPGVILRTSSELTDVIARNPFAKRQGIEASKLLVTFLAQEPGLETREEIRRISTGPEEVHVGRRELYIYFPEGMGRSKLWPVVEKALKKSGTSRNWNTVTKLLEMAEMLVASH